MQVSDSPEPEPRDDEALLEIVAIGLCGSDYHLFDGTHPSSHFPSTQGHEFAGIVRSIPAGNPRGIGVGDLVAVQPLLACGRCYACRRDRPNCCAQLDVIGASVAGALTEKIAVPVELLHPAGDLDSELAALVEPVSIGLHALRRANVDAGDTVLVLGGGPIGLAATLAAWDAGCRVIVADRVPARLARALEAGAIAVIDSDSDDFASAVMELTGGEGPAAVIDATGAPRLIRTAVEVVANAGTVVVVGISSDDLSVPVALLTRKELSLVGSRNSTNEFGDALELVRRHAAVVKSWITHRVELDEVPVAIAFARDHPELVEKMIVRVEHSLIP